MRYLSNTDAFKKMGLKWKKKVFAVLLKFLMHTGVRGVPYFGPIFRRSFLDTAEMDYEFSIVFHKILKNGI